MLSSGSRLILLGFFLGLTWADTDYSGYCNRVDDCDRFTSCCKAVLAPYCTVNQRKNITCAHTHTGKVVPESSFCVCVNTNIPLNQNWSPYCRHVHTCPQLKTCCFGYGNRCAPGEIIKYVCATDGNGRYIPSKSTCQCQEPEATTKPTTRTKPQPKPTTKAKTQNQNDPAAKQKEKNIKLKEKEEKVQNNSASFESCGLLLLVALLLSRQKF